MCLGFAQIDFWFDHMLSLYGYYLTLEIAAAATAVIVVFSFLSLKFDNIIESSESHCIAYGNV